MAAFEDISKALMNAMLSNGTINPDTAFGLPVVFENVPYDETDGANFLACYLLPAPVLQATLGDEGCDNHSGIYQIDIHFQSFTGTNELYAKADEINAVIKSGSTFTFNGLNVRIENISISRLNVSDGQATLNISVEWFAFTMRV